VGLFIRCRTETGIARVIGVGAGGGDRGFAEGAAEPEIAVSRALPGAVVVPGGGQLGEAGGDPGGELVDLTLR
jgi:hypothetical protein